MDEPLALYRQLDPPYETFHNSVLGGEFPGELRTVSRLWFACGYRPGITAYLNFFLLREFIVTHDTAYAPRFQSFRSMADSFYQTDLFIRDVTDSGRAPTGGISSEAVRATLKGIMRRHRQISIPGWMMTYFGWSLLENVEKECEPLTTEEKRLHLAYMTKTFRIMGLAFSIQRDLMDAYGRRIEAVHAGLSPSAEKHARNILLLGEMVGVSSAREAIAARLPEATRRVFDGIYPRVRPGPLRRLGARLLGRLSMKQAIGEPRAAVPLQN